MIVESGDWKQWEELVLSILFTCFLSVLVVFTVQQCKVCSESGKSCGPTGPPDGPGVEGSDFVLYVSGITTERCGQENIVAYAAYCQLEAELDRWEVERGSNKRACSFKNAAKFRTNVCVCFQAYSRLCQPVSHHDLLSAPGVWRDALHCQTWDHPCSGKNSSPYCFLSRVTDFKSFLLR